MYLLPACVVDVASFSFRPPRQDLNAVCDVNCRDNAALMFVDPLTGFIVIIDGNSTGKCDSRNLTRRAKTANTASA